MNREDKKKYRQERALRRVQKKKDERAEIQRKMRFDEINFYQARARVRGNYSGRGYSCEMGYVSCELRGYCNGDC